MVCALPPLPPRFLRELGRPLAPWYPEPADAEFDAKDCAKVDAADAVVEGGEIVEAATGVELSRFLCCCYSCYYCIAERLWCYCSYCMRTVACYCNFLLAELVFAASPAPLKL